jgi:hypothetical protein
MTIIIDETAAAGAARADLVTAFADSGAFIATHPRARIPDSPVLSIRVNGATREERLADLREIAAGWEVPVTEDDMGTLIARRRIGPLLYEAHVSHPDGTVSGFLARADAARAAQAGTGAAA